MSRWRRRGAVILLLLGLGSLLWAALLWRGIHFLDQEAVATLKPRVYISVLIGLAQAVAGLAVLTGSKTAVWAALFVTIAHGSLIAARCGVALTSGQHDPRRFLGPFTVLATIATVIIAMCRALKEEGSEPES